MAHLWDILEWKYGAVADTAGGKITAWRHPSIPQPDEVQLEADKQEYIAHQAKILYQKKRAADYPPIGDQLDAIYNGFKAIQAFSLKVGEETLSIPIGPEAEAWVAAVEAVKAKHPKPA